MITLRTSLACFPLTLLASSLWALGCRSSTEDADRNSKPDTSDESDGTSWEGGKDDSDSTDGGTSTSEPELERGPLPTSENAWFPFDEPKSKYFNACSRPVAFVGSKDVPSGTAAILQDASGAAEYFRAPDGLVLLSGIYAPITPDSYLRSKGADVVFDDEVLVWSADWDAGEQLEFDGEGTVTIGGADSSDTQVRELSFAGRSTYWGEEEISVPAGDFTAQHVEYTLDVTVELEEEPATVSLVVELWFAEGVGIVRRKQNETSFELTHYDDAGLAASSRDARNCPYRSLTEQHEYAQIDGPRVFYTQSNRFGQGPFELFVAPLSGLREPQRLNAPLGTDPNGPSVQHFVVSPSGQHVAYGQASHVETLDELFVVSLKDGAVHPLDNDNQQGQTVPLRTSLAWAPDGSRIAYAQHEEEEHVSKVELWTDAADGGDARLVAEDVEVDFQWSPDSKFIAFLGPHPDGVERYDLSVHVAEVSSGEVRRVSPNDQRATSTTDLSWLPDGSGLIYGASPFNESTGSHNQLHYASADGGSNRVLSPPEHSVRTAHLSPDGRYVAYGDGLFVVGLEDSSVVQLAPDGTHSVSSVVWSHDSTHLAFIAFPEATEPSQLFTVATDGSDYRRISDEGQYVYNFQVSPTDQVITYGADQNSMGLYSARFDGSERHQLNVEDGEPLPFGRVCSLGPDGAMFSPDGSRVAFCSNDGGDEDTFYTTKPNGSDLVQVDTYFGRRRMSLDFDAFQWSLDSQQLIFRADVISVSGYQLYAAPATEPRGSIKLSGTTYYPSTIVTVQPW